MVFQIGDVIGSYKITGAVGQGGMATVYKAYHERLDRHVAVKVMHQTFLQDDSFIARFEREAKIVARLEHSNIVPIYDFSEHNNNPFLVMKYIEGRTLKQRILKSGISLSEAMKMMNAIADALDYAHQKSILHRDIKPSNILVDADDQPYLTDFGLARIAQVGESTISHDMMLGTPFYISPEQARGDQQLDHHTDIYSLAVILYELLVGHVPFTGDTPYAVVHSHIYRQPIPPSDLNPDLPDAVNDVMSKGLHKTPTERFDSAKAMMQALQTALEISDMTDLPPLQNTPIVQSYPSQQYADPEPDTVYATDSKGRKVKVEQSYDMGRFNWDDVGEKLGSKIERGIAAIFNDSKGKLSQEEEIRRRIEKRLKKRRDLMTHVGIYTAINLMLWMIFVFNAIEEVGTGVSPAEALFPWPMIISLAWGAGLFAQWVEYREKWGAGAKRREAMIQEEIERELGYSTASRQREKAKNDLALEDLVEDSEPESKGVRLTDEGEFTDSFANERGWGRRHARRRNRR